MFHHTELTSVLPHRWPSFTTLGKPTIWMVTYLSPSYTRIWTHTYTVCFTESPTSYIYIYIYSVSPHRDNICFTTQIAQIYHTGETNNLDGDLSITILYTHIYTHAHIYTGCFTDSPPSYTYIYKHIYALFHHTEWSICFTAQIAHHHVYIYIYIYTLFHHTELTSVLPHRWPSFTTLGKPTIWMVTYLSPPYTPTCTHIHTNILFVLQITHHHTHTYIYIYTMFHHTELSICFTAQMAQFCHTGETNNLGGDLSITILYTHMYTHTYCLFYR